MSKSIEPYQPDYSAAVPAQPVQKKEEPPRRGNCFERVFIALMIFISFICVLALGAVLLGVDTVGDSTSNVIDSLADLFDGQRALNIDIKVIQGAIQQQAFLETARQNQSIEVNVEDKVRVGDLVAVPVTRGIRFDSIVTVTAGVDLRLMSEANYVVTGETLVITLPQAQLKDCFINEEASTFDRNTYCSTLGNCRDLEAEARRQVLEVAATQDIDEIRQQAFLEASPVIESIVRGTGFEGEITIQQSEDILLPVAEGGSCVQSAVLIPATATP